MAVNNNNEDPNFERRLMIAFGLSVLLFLVVLPFLNKKTAIPPPPTTKTAAVQTTPAAKPAAPAAKPPAPSTAPGKSAKSAKPVQPATPATIEAGTEQPVSVRTPVYTVTLSNRGGVVRDWILTQYKDDNGQPLEVVDPAFSKEFGYPLSFWIQSDSALQKRLNNALFQVQRSTGPNGAQTIEFTWASDGIEAKKQIQFQNGYIVNVSAGVTRDGQPVTAGLAWPGAFGDRAVPGDFNTEQIFQQNGTGVDTFAAKKVNSGTEHSGQYDFVGVEDQYFAAAFLPQGSGPLNIVEYKNYYEPRQVNASGKVITNKGVDTLGFAVSQNAQLQTRLFVGPKEINLLRSINPALRQLVDFGWFSFVAEPLFLWMNWTYIHWIHNYGWVILFLTFILTMAAFPLKLKAQKSQAKMMALQPKINALNAKMKKYPMRDPRRAEVQQEIMKMYSEYGVNPLGGCLPMLVTLPLIYAFWRVLEYAIELRHAPWIGYVHDLSARDPYFILPGVVVLSQFFMMGLMPMAPGQDPRQAKMMKWLMPVMMGWFFFYLPAGVNLYYLGYNIIGAGQQWVANRIYNDKAVKEIEALDAAKGIKTTRKKALSGKAAGKLTDSKSN